MPEEDMIVDVFFIQKIMDESANDASFI